MLERLEKQTGFKARNRVKELILNKPVVIITDKDTSSFDRWITDVFYFNKNQKQVNLAT